MNKDSRRLLRLPQVLEIVPFGKSTLWDRVKKGLFPQPVKLGAKITAWRIQDIYDYIDSLNVGRKNHD